MTCIFFLFSAGLFGVVSFCCFVNFGVHVFLVPRIPSLFFVLYPHPLNDSMTLFSFFRRSVLFVHKTFPMPVSSLKSFRGSNFPHWVRGLTVEAKRHSLQLEMKWAHKYVLPWNMSQVVKHTYHTAQQTFKVVGSSQMTFQLVLHCEQRRSLTTTELFFPCSHCNYKAKWKTEPWGDKYKISVLRFYVSEIKCMDRFCNELMCTFLVLVTPERWSECCLIFIVCCRWSNKYETIPYFLALRNTDVYFLPLTKSLS